MGIRKRDNEKAFAVMTLDILREVLMMTEDLDTVTNFLSYRIRELSGAKCVLIYKYSDDTESVTSMHDALLCASPEWYTEKAASPSFRCLLEFSEQQTNAVLVRTTGDSSQTAKILHAMNFDLTLVLPLIADHVRIGAVFICGLIDDDHLTEIIQMQETLSKVFSLVFRNSYLINNLDQLVQEQTHELTIQNQKLQKEIEERIKAEDQIKLLNESLEVRIQQRTAELENSNKELEAFAYAVSHDLRTPLRAINGFSQALLEDCDGQLSEDGTDYLKRICNASEKMGELIDDMLTLSRISRAELSLENVNMSKMAQEISRELQQHDPCRKAIIDIEENMTATADPRLLRIFLQNILSNAWKFTSKKENTCIAFRKEAGGNHNEFYIQDNGAGFDMEYASSMFCAFRRLHSDSEFPGTGVGLATVQRIITRHGGDIRAEGTVGLGAKFTFQI